MYYMSKYCAVIITWLKCQLFGIKFPRYNFKQRPDTLKYLSVIGVFLFLWLRLKGQLKNERTNVKVINPGPGTCENNGK